jgi:hypothetical protein
MKPPTHSFAELPVQLRIALERSISLGAVIWEAWQGLGENDEAKESAPIGLCSLSLDHGHALRAIIGQIPPSAIALLRPQYECLVRAVWARHAASPSDLARLLAPLTSESQQAAKKLPMVPEMLKAIEDSGPKGAAALLGRARTRLGDGLNSFIHGGIHPFQRGQNGYPLPLLIDVLKNSNAMSVLTLLVLAELVNDAGVFELIKAVHGEFQDILPVLEPL